MSGVHPANGIQTSAGAAAGGTGRARALPVDPSQRMLDVLYDILATGIDPEQSQVPVEAVERFLHEHARAPKSAAELHAFFARHGLTLQGRSLPPPPPPPISLPPLAAPANASPAALKFPVELGIEPVVEIEDEPPSRAAARRGAGSQPWLWAAVALLLLSLGAGGFYGYRALSQLQQRLDRANADSAQDRATIEALKHQAVDLESNVAASSELIQRVDQKSDLMLQTVLGDDDARGHKKKHR